EREAIRVQASQALLNFGFRFFETHKLYEGGTALTEVRVWKGAQTMVPLGLEQALYVTLPRGQKENVQTSLHPQAAIQAPVAKGAPYGTVKAMLAENLLVEQPLVALQDIPQGGLWRRLVDWFLWQLQALWGTLMGLVSGAEPDSSALAGKL
ncbi:MAG: hypothetical protein ACRERD_02160, partial [Candidatus Binatia bacterium]